MECLPAASAMNTTDADTDLVRGKPSSHRGAVPPRSSQYVHVNLRRPSLRFKKSFRTRRRMADRQCSELALEGERLCREGQWEAGIERLEAATRTGSSDSKTLSALYSQLGNAYYYLEDFSKAIEYHRQDLTIARQMGDKLGEAKSCGNIGSALKAMCQFDEAIACCRMQLDLARELGDRVLESRALYNLGNGYHSKGKQTSLSAADSGASQEEVEELVRDSLEQAARHYEANLKIVRERNDYAAMGRTVGNLGNTYYLLGNYKKAIKYHEERLSIAANLNDYGAKRRALSNLGNAYVFLGKYTHAEQCYLTAMAVAREIHDLAFVAQSCYSLGNTFTLVRNYAKAIEYHNYHLQYAQQLEDRVGEERAYWSLGNAYTCLGEHRHARHYAERHLQLATELGDVEGVAIAQKNLRDLDNALDLSDKYECSLPKGNGSVTSPGEYIHSTLAKEIVRKKKAPVSLRRRLKEKVTFRLDFTFGGKSLQSPDSRSIRSESTGSPDSSLSLGHVSLHEVSPTGKEDDAAKTDVFFDMICKYQSQRLDEQRAFLPPCPSHSALQGLPASAPAPATSTCKKASEDDQLLEMLFKLQHSRLNEQRCEMPSAPHLVSRCGSQPHDDEDESDDVSSSSEEEEEEEEEDEKEAEEARDHFEDYIPPRNQALPLPQPPMAAAAAAAGSVGVGGRRRSTMPSEDFFNLIQHLQSTRIEDQRSPLPVLAN